MHDATKDPKELTEKKSLPPEGINNLEIFTILGDTKYCSVTLIVLIYTFCKCTGLVIK